MAEEVNSWDVQQVTLVILRLEKLILCNYLFSLANFPNYVVDRLPLSFPCGVYYGWASVNNEAVHKMVMSVGTNPHFHNNFKTMVSSS